MAAIDFPAAPTVGQAFTAGNGVIYVWNGLLWVASGSSAPGGDFYATKNATGFGTTSTLVTVIFETVVTGNSGGWYSISTGRYTPRAGRYTLSASMLFYTGSGAVVGYLDIRKNGTTIGITESQTTSSGPAPGQIVKSVTVDANGTDWFDVQVGTNTAAAATSGYFQAFPISGIKGPPGDYPLGLKLYDEQVLVSPGQELKVTIPAIATVKKIELSLASITVGFADGFMVLQTMQGATAIGAGYTMQKTLANGGVISGGATVSGTSWFQQTAAYIAGNVRLQRFPDNNWYGDGLYMIQTNAGGRWSVTDGYLSGGDPSLTTGFRFFSNVNLQAGSYLRCFVVS